MTEHLADGSPLVTPEVQLGAGGLELWGPGRRVWLRGARPAAQVWRDGRAVWWRPGVFEVDGSVLRASGGPGDLVLELRAAVEHDAPGLGLRVRLRNDGDVPVAIERLVVCETAEVGVGVDPRRWRIYRNGYQSWAGTQSIGVEERDRDLPLALARAAVTDARHGAPSGPGHVRSDGLGAVVEPGSGDALAVSFTALADAFGFVEVDAPAGRLRALAVWADLDGVELAPGGDHPEVSAHVALASGPPAADAGWHALRSVAEVAGRSMAARVDPGPPPGGWCSWYYYFTKVTEPDVRADLAVLAADGPSGPDFGCSYVMVDDGHQEAIGDWLATDGESFPSGMAQMASEIRSEGFDAGLWWAPFLAAPRSKVARDHPEWLLRNGRGRRVVGLFNPAWEKAAPIWVLDTTRDDVLAHLREVARTITQDWGYRIQKLDFLYAAALEGVHADPTATRAMALRRGLDAVRSGAGEEAFLLGCGCPPGPAVGVVDAMRIGADVTPYWSNVLDRVAGRGLHGLATRNAVRNTLTRAVLDGLWWRNDPDCLLARDTETRLTTAEVQFMATAFSITDGMLVLSDRMATVSRERRALVTRARGLAGGRCEVVDLFERAFPEVVVARHADRVDVAVFNPDDHERMAAVDLIRCGLDLDPSVDLDLEEFWTGRSVPVRGGRAELGLLGPHSVDVISVSTTTR